MPEPHRQLDSPGEPQGVTAGFRHLAPVGQPSSVHESSAALYKPFTEQGSAGLKFHISGCHIDPIPFVQLASGEYRVLNGQPVSAAHAKSLGLSELEPLETPPTVWNTATQRQEFLRELEVLRHEATLADAADGAQSIIWCNHVHGTLTAAIKDASIEIPFSMWAMRLARGLDQCPAWHCPQTGIDTYNLAADDEGTISDADAIVTCAETGRRLLKTKMEACSATGQLVDKSVLAHCPVHNHQFLQRLATSCQGCGQAVDPSCLVKNQCSTCRDLQKIKPQDFLSHPELTELVQKHAWLRQVRKTKLARQPRHWMLQFVHDGVTWRVLFERRSAEFVAVSRSTGWLRPWQPLEKEQWPAFLNQ